ncbi:FimV/HubP family polar landmark protein [Marinobacterium sp. MBR-109]|jgi:pilus assembly protein FimV|uniref:FimV/HubP family polar landmark protein n=1 Tax=Marinobacterium sp. MBR-109 TaxID=3156462 RepID=UPI003391AC40
MLRKLALSLAVSAALGVSQVHALGLGEIQVNSALNEPLDAEIKLTQVRDLSPLQIQPRMAAVDEYSLSGGVSQTRYLRDIQFQVLLTPDGAGSIRLRSSEPIQEPFLNFMVEVNWPSGRMVREYTLLLDPPVFDPTPVQRTVQPAQVQRPAAAQPAEPRQRPVTGSRTGSTSNIRTRMDSETQVYVGVNDTLWEIAARSKPGNISEHQMMLALLRKNPAAFPTGNINTMRAGVVLDLPTPEEAARLTHREAVAEVARQTQIWREGRASRQQAEEPRAPVDVSRQDESEASTDDSAATAPVDESAEQAQGEAAPADEGQLKIVAPLEESEADAQEETEAGSETVTTEEAGAPQQDPSAVSAAQENLENDVLIAQEKIDRLERENTDLNDKLNSVLEQLEAQSRLLELQSQQMATLQTELSRDPAAAASESESQNDKGLLQNPAVLGGIGAGAVAILAGLWLMLRRRGSSEPDKKRELVNVPDNLRDEDDVDPPAGGRDAATSAAVAGGAAAVAAAAAADDETDQPVPLAPLSGESDEFSRPPMQNLAPDEADTGHDDLEQDLQSLDLDMDLDLNDLDIDDEPDLDQLDDSVEQLAEDSDVRIDATEFDLGAEDEPVAELAPLAAAEEPAEEAEPEPESVSTDDELEFSVKPQEPEDEPSELDSMLGDDDDSDDLDFLLSGAADKDDDGAQAVSDDEALLEDALKEDNGFSLADDAVAITDDSDLDDDELLGELETDEPANDNSLHETVTAMDTDDYEIDHDLEAMLQGAAVESEEDEADIPAGDSADDDLDSLLASFEPEDDLSAGVAPVRPGEQVEEELTANISHDLEMDLDSEVDELLNSTDDEIALEEQRSDEAVDVLDKMNLLSGTDEIETKLDLARAYMEMDDKDGARDILNEITSEGTDEQRQEAQKLLDSLS